MENLETKSTNKLGVNGNFSPALNEKSSCSLSYTVCGESLLISSARIFPCGCHWWTYIKELPWNTYLLIVWNILNIKNMCLLNLQWLKKIIVMNMAAKWPCFRGFEKGLDTALIPEWLICDYLLKRKDEKMLLKKASEEAKKLQSHW